jgi:hypothetical protein
MDKNINRQAWILVINSDNMYEPKEVTIKRTYPSSWNSKQVDYGVEYERIGRIKRIRIPSRQLYFTKIEAQIASISFNEGY